MPVAIKLRTGSGFFKFESLSMREVAPARSEAVASPLAGFSCCVETIDAARQEQIAVRET